MKFKYQHLYPATKATVLRTGDVSRLCHLIRSSRLLNEVLIMDTVPTEDLRRLVMLELHKSSPRITIVSKLLGRINIRERNRVLEELRRAKASS